MKVTNKFRTADGALIEISEAGITEVKLTVGNLILGRTKRFIPRAEVVGVVVGDANRQYATGKRAVGVVLTGGAALLAPSRLRANIAVSLADGSARMWTLDRSGANNIQLHEASFRALGYPVGNVAVPSDFSSRADD
jgi:hypothetical protein